MQKYGRSTEEPGYTLEIGFSQMHRRLQGPRFNGRGQGGSETNFFGSLVGRSKRFFYGREGREDAKIQGLPLPNLLARSVLSQLSSSPTQRKKFPLLSLSPPIDGVSFWLGETLIYDLRLRRLRRRRRMTFAKYCPRKLGLMRRKPRAAAAAEKGERKTPCRLSFSSTGGEREKRERAF